MHTVTHLPRRLRLQTTPRDVGEGPTESAGPLAGQLFGGSQYVLIKVHCCSHRSSIPTHQAEVPLMRTPSERMAWRKGGGKGSAWWGRGRPGLDDFSSSNTSTAVSKLILCFARLARLLTSSHSKRIICKLPRQQLHYSPSSIWEAGIATGRSNL